MQKENPMSFKDKIMTAGALSAMVFHAGTFYAVKDKVENHDKEIETLKRENNRQQIEIEVLTVKLKRGE